MPEETQGIVERTFTQDQLNSMLADHKRTLQAENAGLKEQIGQLSTQWSEFQTMLSGMVGEEEGSEGEEEPLASGGTEDELNKRLVWLQKKHEQKLAGLPGIVGTEKSLRQ